MVPKLQRGAKSGSYEEEITASRVGAFAAAIGADPAGGVPPTYLTVFRKGEFEILQGLKIPLSRVLHGEQEYSYESALRVGDRVRYETLLIQAVEKRGASSLLQVLVLETRFRVGERPAAAARTTLLMKGER